MIFVINANDYDTREELERAMENEWHITLKYELERARDNYIIMKADIKRAILSLNEQISETDRKISDYYKYLREKKSNANLNSS